MGQAQIPCWRPGWAGLLSTLSPILETFILLQTVYTGPVDSSRLQLRTFVKHVEQNASGFAQQALLVIQSGCLTAYASAGASSTKDLLSFCH